VQHIGLRTSLVQYYGCAVSWFHQDPILEQVVVWEGFSASFVEGWPRTVRKEFKNNWPNLQGAS